MKKLIFAVLCLVGCSDSIVSETPKTVITQEQFVAFCAECGGLQIATQTKSRVFIRCNFASDLDIKDTTAHETITLGKCGPNIGPVEFKAKYCK